MIQVILFDLDGTLLPMDNEYFTKYYLQLLGKKFDELGYDANLSIKGVWNGLKYMVGNQGSVTNEEAFWNGFQEIMHQKMKHTKEELNELLLMFYQREFHEARHATKPCVTAKRIIQSIQHKGVKLVLATNPIFPKQAVLTRLNWIDLKEDDFDFITTYETSHFCKPNPAYYQEIMDKLNLSAKNCVMIGNDISEDIEPASSLNIKTYLVKDHQIGDSENYLDAGSLVDVASWLKDQMK